MAAKGGFYHDFSDFDRDFRRIVEKTHPDLVKKGLVHVCDELLHDSDKQIPQTPHKVGDLKGSKHKKIELKGTEIIAYAGYNIVYAAWLHEGSVDWSWTRDWVKNPGPKFLESKLPVNKDKYMKIIAKTIERGAR